MSLKELNVRQRRRLELIKDNDCTINYYLGKANVVADALSLEELIEEFEHLMLKVNFLGRIQDSNRT